jgi:hypothetical protein
MTGLSRTQATRLSGVYLKSGRIAAKPSRQPHFPRRYTSAHIALLAARVLPSKRFGANAAWLRLAVLTLNVLTALKRLALPPELLLARPKRLRFLFFNTTGRIAYHARKVLVRLAMMAQCKTICRGAFRLLSVGT